MIVSASYKTDIPAFYGEWFLHRLHAGYCRMINPYNRAQQTRISLLREDVDGFVFWTKNAGPFLPVLDEVHRRGFPFLVHFTINAYPRALEFSVTDPGRAIGHAEHIASNFGQRCLVWRYDPIVFSSETPVEHHIEAFERLASRLRGLTDEVIVSFAQIYRKTRRNMEEAARTFHFTWHDPDEQTKRALLRQLLGIARSHGMKLSLCSQPDLLEPGVDEARCIDARRLSTIAGFDLAARLKGARKECGCFESKDIGDYDTCPHGCVYCYAVRHRRLAQQNFRRHDPRSEFLLTPA